MKRDAKNNNDDQSTPFNTCLTLCLEKITIKPPPTIATIGMDNPNILTKKNPKRTKKNMNIENFIFPISDTGISISFICLF